VIGKFEDVAILANNAGTASGGSDMFEDWDDWDRVFAINFGGVLNRVRAFAEHMRNQLRPSAIVNTGYKQGFTSPPGNSAYNVSKAAVRSFTEALAYTLRNEPAAMVSAHLLVPGFTYSAMVEKRFSQKPPAAWTCEQVADALFEGLARNDFYIWCEDNETSRALDGRRLLWVCGDVIENRPALSRWHPDYEDAFEAFCRE
jgi:NAD(P)-dependent dehydrogenase (short-subunit alcohol dehydrogenase family)